MNAPDMTDPEGPVDPLAAVSGVARASESTQLRSSELEILLSLAVERVERMAASADIQTLLRIDPLAIDLLAESANAWQFARATSMVSKRLQSPHLARENSIWLQYGGIAMRRAREYELASRFFARARKVAGKHGDDERYVMGSIGLVSAAALAGDFRKAGRARAAIRGQIRGHDFWVLSQNYIDTWRFASAVGNNELRSSAADGLYRSLDGVAVDDLSRAKVEGIIAKTSAEMGNVARAYESGIRSAFPLLVKKRHWAFMQYIGGLESGLQTFCMFETPKRALESCGRARREWSSTGKLSEVTSSQLSESLGNLYAHYLEHHADNTLRYDNTYRVLLPEESSLDKDLGDCLLTATKGYSA